MTTQTHTVTDSDIRAAVVGKGYVAATITRQYVKPRPEAFGSDHAGEWFVLFVDGQCWGRRRTLQELLKLAERGPLFEANVRAAI